MPSRVWFFVTLWTEACQAPLSMEFSRQEDWSGLPFPTPGDLPKPGIEPASLASLVLADGFFTAASHMHIHTHMRRTTRLCGYSKVNAFCNAMNCYWSLLRARHYSRSCSFLGSTLLLITQWFLIHLLSWFSITKCNYLFWWQWLKHAFEVKRPELKTKRFIPY